MWADRQRERERQTDRQTDRERETNVFSKAGGMMEAYGSMRMEACDGEHGLAVYKISHQTRTKA